MEGKNNHDYLLCGEDYQGQTIIRLNDGRRKNFLSPGSHKGQGFCWASVIPSPNKTKLAVFGCIWAFPYEILIFNFSEPFKQPEFLGWLDEGSLLIDDLVSWNKDDAITVKCVEGFRKSDGKLENKLTSEELDKAITDDNLDEREKFIELSPIYKK